MTKRRELAPTYALEHSREAVRRGLAIEGSLLSAGEMVIVRRWSGLSDPAAHAFARLLQRRRQPIRIEQFQHPSIPNMVAALTELQQNGFVSLGPQIPVSMRLERLKVQELRDHCRGLSLSPGGAKAALIERLSSRGIRDTVGMVLAHHRGLFTRLYRSALQSHSGDLSREVLDQMGLRRSASYTLTTGAGRFRNRRRMLNYEEALEDRSRVLANNTLERATEIIDKMARDPMPEPWEYRFSAHRQLEKSLLDCLREAERVEQPDQVAALYRSACSVVKSNRGQVLWRLALTEERAGRADAALSVCIEGASKHPEVISLHRTGSRIARTISARWPYPSDMLNIGQQLVQLPIGSGRDGPLRTDEGIESAVVRNIAHAGRLALHSENGVWTTLFALLYDRALFAPIQGALPCPHLSGPLDLGTPAFRSRRASLIRDIQAATSAGKTGPIVEEAWQKRFGQAVAGVRWDAFDIDQLATIASSLEPKSLNAVMDVFIDDWYGAKRGLPDLTIMPGAPIGLDGVSVGPTLTMVEIKGPGDTLRDHQVWWIKTLRGAGIPAQVWRVKPLRGNT